MKAQFVYEEVIWIRDLFNTGKSFRLTPLSNTSKLVTQESPNITLRSREDERSESPRSVF